MVDPHLMMYNRYLRADTCLICMVELMTDLPLTHLPTDLSDSLSYLPTYLPTDL